MVTLFYGKESPLSNFHPCRIVHRGRVYTSSEQVFMALKAIEFDDDETLQKIGIAKTPMAAKMLGRKVKGYVDEHWCRVRRARMFEACLAKFSQNPELRKVLLETSGTRLAEASPKDRVWGIGMGASHPNAQDPSKWPPNSNMLGSVLEQVREHIRAEMAKQTPETRAALDEAVQAYADALTSDVPDGREAETVAGDAKRARQST